MKNVSRRKLIKAMLAAPLIGTVNNLGFANPNTVSAAMTGGGITKVNVVLHGLMAVVINPGDPNKDVQILIPQVDDAMNMRYSHVYRAGSYNLPLGPTYDLSSHGRYNLTGIKRGTSSLTIDSGSNAIIRQ